VERDLRFEQKKAALPQYAKSSTASLKAMTTREDRFRSINLTITIGSKCIPVGVQERFR